MRFGRAFDDVFRSAAHVAVLRALVGLPGGFRASAREIARRAGISHPVELKALRAFVELGLVRVHRAPRADAYELNRSHVLAEPIVQMFAHEQSLRPELLGFLRRQVRRYVPGAEQAYLFGSAARDETGPRSDIDVAVLWPGASRVEVDRASQAISEAVRERYGSPGQVIVLVANASESAMRSSRAGRGLWRKIVTSAVPLLPAERKRRTRRA